jgi:opacity protein-like surface antigen
MKCPTVLLIAILATVQITSPVAAQDEPVVANKEAKAADPSGTWRLEYDWNETRVKEAFRLNLEKKGMVVGTLLRNDTTFEIKKGRVKGNEISFSISGDYQGTEWTANYTAKINEDEMDGTVVLEANGQSWNFPWQPKRSVKMEDVIGTWNIRIESSDGTVFEPTMKISKEGEEYKSTYTSMQGYELEVKDLHVEKNHLMFSVAAEWDGNSLNVDYDGRPYGDKINGTVKYDFSGNSGDLEFVAKRKREKIE